MAVGHLTQKPPPYLSLLGNNHQPFKEFPERHVLKIKSDDPVLVEGLLCLLHMKSVGTWLGKMFGRSGRESADRGSGGHEQLRQRRAHSPPDPSMW